MNINAIISEIKRAGSKGKAERDYLFFKCDGGYGAADDEFCGAPVPSIRALSKKYRDGLSFGDLDELLKNRLHEARFFALAVLSDKYDEGAAEAVEFYLSHTHAIDNWDLVDLTAYRILGRRCFDRGDYKEMYRLSASRNMWEQRISMVATWFPTHKGNFKPALDIAEKFVRHRHDLMHKASGWMLREVGKQGAAGRRALLGFLKKHASGMPRVMLRYAIERFGPAEKAEYMGKRA